MNSIRKIKILRKYTELLYYKKTNYRYINQKTRKRDLEFLGKECQELHLKIRSYLFTLFQKKLGGDVTNKHKKILKNTYFSMKIFKNLLYGKNFYYTLHIMQIL